MKRTYFRNIVLVLILVFSLGNLRAQSITVNTWLDTSLILIGDQIKYHIELEQDKDLRVDFPTYPDTIVDNIEVLQWTAIDTTYLSDKIIKLSQEYLITSFDSGVYVIPAQAFAFSGEYIEDTIYSNPLYLGVLTFQIDSIAGIMDIKPPIDTPVNLEEILPYTGYTLLILAILAALVILIIWLSRKKKNQPIISRPKPKIPGHIIALNDLDELKKQKLWQQGKEKEYQSRLTDIIRTYIEDRYRIPAMEQTTDEILGTMERTSLLNLEQNEMLTTMLKNADLVKFAKMKLVPDEHEKSLKDAYSFVNQTKQKVDLSSQKADEESSNLKQENNNG